MQTEHSWVALVQLRQKVRSQTARRGSGHPHFFFQVDHKRTFYFLEQLILKHNAQQQALNIKEVGDGIDFFWGHRSHAMKFIDFLQNVVPIRYKMSEQLISQDDVNNTYNYKYTFSVEIAPICRVRGLLLPRAPLCAHRRMQEDLICLPAKFASAQGNISPLVLCSKISSLIHVIDPNTLQVGEILAANYWKFPFRSIASNKQLTEFVILDINPLDVTHGKYRLAEATVARSSDLGANDTQFFCRTHLGNILHPGDSAMGFACPPAFSLAFALFGELTAAETRYHVATCNFNDDDLKSFKFQKNVMPDVVLVRKVYPTAKKSKSRVWRLKQLNKVCRSFSFDTSAPHCRPPPPASIRLRA